MSDTPKLTLELRESLLRYLLGRGDMPCVEIPCKLGRALADALTRLPQMADRIAELEAVVEMQSADVQRRMGHTLAYGKELARVMGERDAMRTRAAVLEAVLREVEWGGALDAEMCPGCTAHKRDRGHAPDCDLAAVLTGKEP